MRLLSTTLKNFGYYANETIDLSRIAAATVIGRNGTGKSTGFVDAVLWCLFEVCRGTTDEMIKPGAVDMSVAVVWCQDGQTYQVVRKRSKRTKAGKSELAFNVRQEDAWQPAGGSLGSTQEKIQRVLACDYDLLTKTAFVLQGQADAFSKSKPTARKKALGSILTLDRYIGLKSRANAAANKVRDRRDTVVTELQAVEGLVGTIPTLQSELDAIAVAIADQQSQLAGLSAQRDALVARKAALGAQQAQTDADRRMVEELQQRTLGLSARIAELDATLERHEAVLAEASEVRAASAEVEHSRHQLESIDLEIRGEIETRLATLTETIASVSIRIGDLQAARERHKTVMAEAPAIRAASLSAEQSRQRLEAINQEIQVAIETPISTLTEKITAVEADRQALQKTQLAYQSARRDLDLLIQGYQAETKRLAQEVERDQATVKLLDRVPCGVDLQKACQFTISAAKIQETLPEKLRAFNERPREPEVIGIKIASQLSEEVARLDAERRAKETTVDLVAYQAMLDERITLTARRVTLRSQQTQLTQALATAQALAARLPEVEAAEQALADAERLAKETSVDEASYQAMVEEHAQLITRRDALRSRQTLLKQAIDTAQALADRLPAVEVAEQALPGIDADLSAKNAEFESLFKEQMAAIERVREGEALAGLIQQVENDLSELVTTEQTITADLQSRLVSKGLCQEKLNAAEAAIPTEGDLRATLYGLDADYRHYTALAEAYGLIPVLVMESSIPILERETNKILSKISSCGLRVRMETQRALTSRDGLAETLDIIASDTKGERRYEIYSGGEKFRLDLALRIGLSKLLANRAGAKLETLVIDEGLGSLDEAGLTQLRECLSALGEEFKCIIVITHVEAMKSTFPSQILVTSDEDGSHVKVFA